MYPLSRKRAARCPRLFACTSMHLRDAAREGAPKICLEDGVGDIEQFPARNHDDVERRLVRVVPENLSNQPFSAIAAHRVAELSGGHDPKPRLPFAVRRHDKRKEAALDSEPDLKNALEIRPPADPVIGSKPARSGARRLTLFIHGCPWHPRGCASKSLRRRNRQALTALGSTAFENKPPVFRAHTHEKPVRAPTVAAVWLERTFHKLGSSATRPNYSEKPSY